MRDKETLNTKRITTIGEPLNPGRIVALDLGSVYIGIAVSDETRTIASPVRTIKRSSWKKTLAAVKSILDEFDATGLVIGLPYNFDGTESPMSTGVREEARKFSLSLEIPVFLQDERSTTFEARGRLWERGLLPKATRAAVDSEAASIILSDFLDLLRSSKT